MSRILEDTTNEDVALDNETKAETFQRLANKRVNNALDKIRLIGNLSSANYEYTEEQVNKIEDALRMATDRIMDKFRKVRRDVNKFEL